MHTILGAVVAAIVSFLLLSSDELFGFARQLALTDVARVKRIIGARATAGLLLFGASAVLAVVLSPIPRDWIGLLGVALVGLAVHAWRFPVAPRTEHRRGMLTTFAMTIVHGGDALVVWTALLRANSVGHDLVMALTYVVMEVIFLASATILASRPRATQDTPRRGRAVDAFAYLLLAALVIWECHTF